MITSRRSLLTGLGGIILAGPAIVRASSIMKVKAAEAERETYIILNEPLLLDGGYGAVNHEWADRWFAEVLNNRLRLHQDSKPVVIWSKVHQT